MTQTIAQLTPLTEVRALIGREVKPVAPCALEIASGAGCVLAEQVVAPVRPDTAIALADGWAMRSEDTAGAGSYAPVLLPVGPAWVESGHPLPSDCDCIAPPDAVLVTELRAEVLSEVPPGQGVLPAGGDHDGARPLSQAGERLGAAQAAAFAALGIQEVCVRRPRLLIATAGDNPILAACAEFVAKDALRLGAVIDRIGAIEAALAAHAADGLIVIGGTGVGRTDASATAVARAGKLAVHGVALAPGETAGFGFVANRPVLLLPGRLDAAIAIWLMLGRALLERLAGAHGSNERPQTWTLARKIASSIGLTEVVPVRIDTSQAEPLAHRYWPLSAIARADGYIVISPESEGASAGSAVQVWPWP